MHRMAGLLGNWVTKFIRQMCRFQMKVLETNGNVTYVLPLAQTLSSKKFESGRVLVDNEAEKDLTVVTINERKDSTAALLDVASAMTGIGVVIHEAIIQVLFPPLTCVESAGR